MSARTESAQRGLIVDQFTKQAVPFSQMRGQSHEESLDLLLCATGVTSADSVVDIACGPGLVVFAFAAVAKRATGIDVTPAMIARARALQAERNLSNVAWLVGDVQKLPFPDAAFDIVTCRYAFHHFLDPYAVAAEMARVCAPGGKVALVDVVTTDETKAAYNRMEKLRDPSHVRALDLTELHGLAVDNGLVRLSSQFYRMEVELEALMQASFPAPGNAAEVRNMLVQDIGKDSLGVDVHWRGTEIVLAYPIALVVSEKPA